LNGKYNVYFKTTVCSARYPGKKEVFSKAKYLKQDLGSLHITVINKKIKRQVDAYADHGEKLFHCSKGQPTT